MAEHSAALLLRFFRHDCLVLDDMDLNTRDSSDARLICVRYWLASCDDAASLLLMLYLARLP